MHRNLLTGLIYYRKQFYAKKPPHQTSKGTGINTAKVGQVEKTFLIRKKIVIGECFTRNSSMRSLQHALLNSPTVPFRPKEDTGM